MNRYKILIEYEGTNYSGWQIQKNSPSIQQAIETAIKKFSGQKVTIWCAGRTDAGVHALAQVAHFDLNHDTYQPQTIINAINYYLKPQPIVILDCALVSNDFHARFAAVKRHYEYIILNRVSSPALEKNRVWHIRKDLDVASMQEAATHLIGIHDFSSFRASQCQALSPIRTIDSADIYTKGNYIYFNISAKSFLHHMVRNIVGTLVQIGLKKISPNDFLEILQTKDRKKAGPTAPAYGLYFKKIDY